MKIALAQVNSVIGDVEFNIQQHLGLIELAAKQDVNCIFFPELSLLGYDPNLAKEMAMELNNKQLDVFETICKNSNMVIGIGVPSRGTNLERISMFLFHPNGERKIYSKQHLYKDESPFFEGGTDPYYLCINDHKIALAICYESLVPEHSNAASDNFSTIYLASVAKSENGVDRVANQYSKIAKSHSMHVLMVNGIGDCGHFICGGKSSIWNKEGILKGQMNSIEEGIMVWDSDTEIAEIIQLEIAV